MFAVCCCGKTEKHVTEILKAQMPKKQAGLARPAVYRLMHGKNKEGLPKLKPFFILQYFSKLKQGLILKPGELHRNHIRQNRRNIG